MYRHMDGNPSNNTLSNLKYGTRSENEQDKKRHGTYHWGENNHRAKLTEEQVIEIRKPLTTLTRRQLAQKYGVSFETIIAIRRKRIWKHL